MSKREAGSLLVTSLVALGCVLPAAAQTARTAQTIQLAEAPAGDQSITLDEIVVTARRREESLQDVPVSITAISGAQLEQQGLTSVQDLRTVAPGVNISGQNRDDAEFFVRGTSLLVQVGQHNLPSTATYFAEVPSNAAGPGTLFDLSSVQILKGPQGTLFGRNTTGGAVLFEPQKPVNHDEGYVDVSGGNYSFHQVEGAVNWAAIPDVVALRLAGTTSRRDGFTTSIITGQKLDDRNFDGARLSLLLTPIDGLESETIADWRHRDGNGNSEIIRGFDPKANLGGTVGANPQLAALEPLGAFAGLTPAQVGSIPLTVGGGASIGCLGFPLPGCPAPLPLPGPYAKFGGIAATLAAAYAGGGLALVAPTSQLNSILATQAAIGPRRTQIPSPLRDKQLDEGVTNRTTYVLTDDITLKNIIAFRRQRFNMATDDDGTPIPFLDGPYVTNQDWSYGQDQFSEEFQLQGNAPSLKLSYIVGLYHEKSEPGLHEEVPTITIGTLTNRFPDNSDKSDAAFGHLEWNPLSKLGFSGGVRETADRRSASLSQLDTQGNCVQIDFSTGNLACPLSITRNFHAVSWDFTANYRPLERTLVYARVARGYKGGGINLPAPPNASTFQPETVLSHEIGVKSDFDIGMPLRIDAAAFYDNYNDMQTEVSSTFTAGNGAQVVTAAVENVPKSVNKGVEVSATLLPLQGLSLAPWFSYLNSHSTVNIPGAITAGRQLPYQPMWKYGLNGQYSYPISEGAGRLVVSADWSWQDQVFNAPTPGIIATWPSYGLLNARIEWQNVMRTHVNVALFGTNLLDKTYIQGGFPIAALGYDAATYGEPRMYGVSLKYEWGHE
jgi:iron complex outermembrane recepter protein